MSELVAQAPLLARVDRTIHPRCEMYGYSRAVRVGAHVHVAGTTAEPSVAAAGAGMLEQAESALERIRSALESVDASVADVVRTVTYVTDASLFAEVARAHKSMFDDIRPVASLVEVSAFAAPEYLIEIEAYAIVE